MIIDFCYCQKHQFFHRCNFCFYGRKSYAFYFVRKLTVLSNDDVWNDPFQVYHWKSRISSRILAPNQRYATLAIGLERMRKQYILKSRLRLSLIWFLPDNCPLLRVFFGDVHACLNLKSVVIHRHFWKIDKMLLNQCCLLCWWSHSGSGIKWQECLELFMMISSTYFSKLRLNSTSMAKMAR